MASRNGRPDSASKRLQGPGPQPSRGGKNGFDSVIPLKDRLEQNRNLLTAAFTGRIADAREALEKGADPDARDRFGRTPLMLAARENFVEIGELLLEHGADPEAKDKAGNTATSYAGMFYNKNMLLLLDRSSAA